MVKFGVLLLLFSLLLLLYSSVLKAPINEEVVAVVLNEYKVPLGLNLLHICRH